MATKKSKIKIRIPLPKQRPKIKKSNKIYSRKKNNNIKEANI